MTTPSTAPDPGLGQPRPLATLLAQPAGDVLAARAFAETMLAGQDRRHAAYREARLILTAAGLRLQTDASRVPTLADLTALLIGLARGRPAAETIGASPLPFLQFSAAEIDDLDPAQRRVALVMCLRACVGAAT